MSTTVLEASVSSSSSLCSSKILPKDGRRTGTASGWTGRAARAAASSLAMQHFLYFLPLLQWQRSFRPILAISPTSLQRTDPVYQAVLADAKFHEQLLVFDRDLAATARAARCWLCGGALHSASYDRKPRGCPVGLGQETSCPFPAPGEPGKEVR